MAPTFDDDVRSESGNESVRHDHDSAAQTTMELPVIHMDPDGHWVNPEESTEA